MDKLTIYKIGGNIVDDPDFLEMTLQNFVQNAGARILVHGGGKIASQILDRMGIQPQMVNGRRITDAPTMQVVQMVYGGLLNKNIVAALQKLGCNALGMSGADGGVILAHKRPAGEIDYGFAGDIDKIQGKQIMKLLAVGFTPVFCPLTHDGQGQLLNTNADTIATELAIALSLYYRVRLIYLFEKPGVLLDVYDESSVISHLDRQGFTRLKDENRIQDGMIPKLDNIFNALQAGVKEALITNGRSDGTRITLN